MSESYSANVICWNCGHKYKVQVPFGVEILKYIPGRNCIKCGCRKLASGYKIQDEYKEDKYDKYV